MSKYLIFAFIIVGWLSAAHAQFAEDLDVTASFSPSTIEPGGTSTFSWSSSGGSGQAFCFFSGLPGLNFSEAPGGSIEITATETLIVDVSCERFISFELPIPTGSARAVLTVNSGTPPPPPPAPTVNSSFSPSLINLGQSATFSWSSTNANSCSSTGALSISGTSGSVAFQPNTTGNQSVTVTCTGAGGSGSSTSVLSVQGVAVPPPSVSAIYSPNVLFDSGFSTLIWNSINATSCSLSGFGGGGPSGAITSFFSFDRTTFVTCFGPGGAGTAIANLIVFSFFLSEDAEKDSRNPDESVTGLMRVADDFTSPDLTADADLSVDKVLLEELGVRLSDENVSSLAIDLNADEIEDRLVYAPESKMLFVLISDNGVFASLDKSVRDISAWTDVKLITVDNNGLVQVQTSK